MNLQKLIFVNNACYKAGRTITVKGIMVHSTGANNPTLRRYVGPDDGKLGPNQYNNHWNQKILNADGSERSVCVHGFIGKLLDGSIATYQTLPWNHRGWHGGSGSKGSVNDTHIGFEICEDGLTDAVYFNAVYTEAAELCAYLCKEYKLDPLGDGVIIGHYEGFARGIASNHGDPKNWFPKHGKSMDTFRAEVKRLMGAVTIPATPAQPETPPAATGTMYRVRKTWADSKTQIGAYTVLSNAKTEADKNKAQGYKVFDDKGVMVYDPNAGGTTVPAAPPPVVSALAEFLTMAAADAAARILEMVKPNALSVGLFPSVKAAQLILESGYLKSKLTQDAYNGFGMKTSLSGNTWAGSSWDGSSKYTTETKEQKPDGTEYTITADFRRYARIEDSIADHSAYLLGAKNGSALRYAGITAAKDYREQAQIIKDGGYATDVSYVQKVCDIIVKFGLDKYDPAPAATAEPSAPKGSGDNPSAWAKDATRWAIDAGLFAGDGNGNYDWQSVLTREAAAQLFYNFQKIIEASGVK